MTIYSTHRGNRPFNCVDQLTATWRQRADLCVELISASNPAKGELLIADIGCGDQKLRDALAQTGIRFSYYGYDLLPQSADVEKFDVCSDALPAGYDIAVMLGVIEYLEGLPEVLSQMAKQVPHLVVSHVVQQGDVYSAGRLLELGWINHLSEVSLEGLLLRCGFAISARRMTPDGRTLLLACTSMTKRASA